MLDALPSEMTMIYARPNKRLMYQFSNSTFYSLLSSCWIPSQHWIWRIEKKILVYYVLKPQFWFSNHKRFPVRYHPIFLTHNSIESGMSPEFSSQQQFLFSIHSRKNQEGHFLLIWLGYWTKIEGLFAIANCIVARLDNVKNEASWGKIMSKSKTCMVSMVIWIKLQGCQLRDSHQMTMEYKCFWNNKVWSLKEKGCNNIVAFSHLDGWAFAHLTRHQGSPKLFFY